MVLGEKDSPLGPLPVDASFIMVPQVFYCDSPFTFITALVISTYKCQRLYTLIAGALDSVLSIWYLTKKKKKKSDNSVFSEHLITFIYLCSCSRMRWLTVHTWALRALTANVRPSQMRTRGLLYPLRCTRMWRQTAASRPRCTTLKTAEQGQ